MPFRFDFRCHQIITAAWAVVFLLAAVSAGVERAAPDFHDVYVVAIGAGPPAPAALRIAKGGADAATRPEVLGPAKRPAQALVSGGDHDAHWVLCRRQAWTACEFRGGGMVPSSPFGHPGDGFLISRLPTGPPA